MNNTKKLKELYEENKNLKEIIAYLLYELNEAEKEYHDQLYDLDRVKRYYNPDQII